jgi:hypothetical protein
VCEHVGIEDARIDPSKITLAVMPAMSNAACGQSGPPKGAIVIDPAPPSDGRIFR